MLLFRSYLVTAALVLASFTVSAADYTGPVVYKYAGNTYTTDISACGIPEVSNLYATVTFPHPLPVNLSVVQVAPSDFSVFNGYSRLLSPNELFSDPITFIVSTNAEGSLTDWTFGANFCVSGTKGGLPCYGLEQLEITSKGPLYESMKRQTKTDHCTVSSKKSGSWSGPIPLPGPREHALALVENWNTAFVASDVEGIVKLFAEDATFLGTSSKSPVVTPEGIRNYFAKALLDTKWRSQSLNDTAVTVLSDTAVIVTGLHALTGLRDGKAVGGDGRITFVMAKRGADWKIVHLHSSAVPN